MHDWIILAAPLLIAALVLTLGFVGCSFHEGAAATPPTPMPNQYRDTILATSTLVSYWRLDEAPGATMAADSKDANNGTYHGGVTLGVPGLLHSDTDTAAQFDGTSGYVGVPFALSLNPPKFTIEALVTVTGGAGGYRSIISSRDVEAGTGASFGYVLHLNPQNLWEAWAGDGSATFKAATVSTAATGGPHYVAVTYDGSQLTLYVDPADQTNPGMVGSVAVAYKPTTKNEFRIGAGVNEKPPQHFFPGVLDEVAIYNDALDFTTIVNHFMIMMMG